MRLFSPLPRDYRNWDAGHDLVDRRFLLMRGEDSKTRFFESCFRLSPVNVFVRVCVDEL